MKISVYGTCLALLFGVSGLFAQDRFTNPIGPRADPWIIKRYLIVLLLLIPAASIAQTAPGKVWSIEKANAWSKEQKWIVGSDYITSTAINQLEMWQADIFDAPTIDKELQWAENIGML